MADKLKSPKKSDMDETLNKPEAFKTFKDEPTSPVVKEPFKEVMKEEPVAPKAEPTTPVKEEPKIDRKVKKYTCKVKCWVSSRCQMFEPGDVVEFADEESVPSHFTLSE